MIRINTVNHSEVDKISNIVPFWFIYSVITKYREINNISFSIAAILLPYKPSSHAGFDQVNTRVPTLGVYARL